jgi:hypothetical protein
MVDAPGAPPDASPAPPANVPGNSITPPPAPTNPAPQQSTPRQSNSKQGPVSLFIYLNSTNPHFFSQQCHQVKVKIFILKHLD